MVPTEQNSETFELFQGISRKRIDRDLANANFDDFGPLARAFYATPFGQHTSQQYANYLHNQLVHAHAAMTCPQLPDVISIHLAAYGREAAQVAVQIAYDSGELGKINRELGRMREQAGVDEEEEWEGKEKPEKYDELMDECCTMLSKISDMMIVNVLRRYRLDPIADLYETNQKEFDEKAMQGALCFSPRKGLDQR